MNVRGPNRLSVRTQSRRLEHGVSGMATRSTAELVSVAHNIMDPHYRNGERSSRSTLFMRHRSQIKPNLIGTI